jgi:hypothetical protein
MSSHILAKAMDIDEETHGSWVEFNESGDYFSNS